MRITSNRHPDRLELEQLDEDYTRARLVVGTLDVSTRVSNFPWREGVIESLGSWFGQLDTEWRGWEGALEWSSKEGEFTVEARHDRRGTVTLSVSLRDALPESWSVKRNLYLDAGGFARLAR